MKKLLDSLKKLFDSLVYKENKKIVFSKTFLIFTFIYINFSIVFYLFNSQEDIVIRLQLIGLYVFLYCILNIIKRKRDNSKYREEFMKKFINNLDILTITDFNLTPVKTVSKNNELQDKFFLEFFIGDKRYSRLFNDFNYTELRLETINTERLKEIYAECYPIHNKDKLTEVLDSLFIQYELVGEIVVLLQLL